MAGAVSTVQETGGFVACKGDIVFDAMDNAYFYHNLANISGGSRPYTYLSTIRGLLSLYIFRRGLF